MEIGQAENGNAWWTEEIKGTVEEKRRTSKKMLEKCARRVRVIKERTESKVLVERLVRERRE